MFQDWQWCRTRVYHFLLPLKCVYGCGDERGENGDGEDRRELRLPGHVYADFLVLCASKSLQI